MERASVKSLRLIVAPTEQPVSRAQVKAHLRREDVDEPSENAWLDAAIAAATDWAQMKTGRQFVTATWEQYFDEFPSGRDPLVLERPPLIDVLSVSYLTGDGSVAMHPSMYIVDPWMQYGELRPLVGSSWPVVATGSINAVTVRFRSGYGSASDVPPAIRQAIMELVASMYMFREPQVAGAVISSVGFAVEEKLAPYTVCML